MTRFSLKILLMKFGRKVFQFIRSVKGIKNFYKVERNIEFVRKRYNDRYKGKIIGVVECASVGTLFTHLNYHLRYCKAYGIDSKEVVLIYNKTNVNDYVKNLYSDYFNFYEDQEFYRAMIEGGSLYLATNRRCLPVEYQNSTYLLSDWMPDLKMPPEGDQRYAQLCKRIGLDPNAPFALVHSRDDFYWKNVRGNKGNAAINQYRNSHFEALIPTCEYLKKYGLQVVRVGHYESVKRASIIEYNGLSDDEKNFLDVYLHCNCKFVIAGQSGVLCFPWVFDKPVLIHNYIPYGNIQSLSKAVIIPRLLRYKNSESKLLLRDFLDFEVPELGRDQIKSYRKGDLFVGDPDYENYGIESVENSAEEILMAFQEFLNVIELDRWGDEELQHPLEKGVRSLFPVSHFMYKNRGFIARSFVEKYREFFS